MKPYMEYIPTDMPWLPSIPAHWQSVKLRDLLSPVSVKGHPELPLLSVVRERGVIVRDVESKEENHNSIPEDLSNYKVVRRGQFAMNKMKAWQGSYAVSDHDGIVSPAYFVFDLRFDNPRFFHRAIRSKAYVSFFAQASDGIRVGQWDLNMDRMRDIPFFIPPRPEQDQIVRYLDHQSSKINALIAAKRREIGLLKEIIQKIIRETVTHGLDTNAEMKDSGLIWLGMIPAHWEIKRAKTMYEKNDRPISENDDIVTCFRDGEVTLRKNRRTTGFTEAIKEIGYQGIRKGDLVIHVMDAFAGSVGVSDSDGKGSPVYSVCSAIGDYNNHFYAHIIRVMAKTGYIQSLSRGIRERSSDFRFDVFANQYLPIPPREEQDAIVSHIEERTRKINDTINSIERQIDLLHELRTRLISDVVTGQIDVRGVSVPEFEIVEETVPEADEITGDDETEE